MSHDLSIPCCRSAQRSLCRSQRSSKLRLSTRPKSHSILGLSAVIPRGEVCGIGEHRPPATGRADWSSFRRDGASVPISSRLTADGLTTPLQEHPPRWPPRRQPPAPAHWRCATERRSRAARDERRTTRQRSHDPDDSLMASVGVAEQPDRWHEHKGHQSAHDTRERTEHPRNGSFRQSTGGGSG